MSKGQQAMAVAMMHPEPAKTKRKGSGSLEPKELGISGARIYSAASAGRVVDLHKPGQLGGIGIRLPRLQTRRNLIFRQFFFKRRFKSEVQQCSIDGMA